MTLVELRPIEVECFTSCIHWGLDLRRSRRLRRQSAWNRQTPL